MQGRGVVTDQVRIGQQVEVKDRYCDQWYPTTIVAVLRDGALLEIRNPHAMSDDVGATLRVPADEIRVQAANCVICGLSLGDHWLASCPDVAGDSVERTWDGEPLWSAETQQDELFAGDAFKQMPGQLPIEEPAS
jgi:hypothetical protein